MDSNEFIANIVSKQTPRVQGKVAEYLAYARQNGVRICNDGYPDTRFKGTFPSEFEKTRRYIHRIREHYAYFYPNAQHMKNRIAKLQREAT